MVLAKQTNVFIDVDSERKINNWPTAVDCDVRVHLEFFKLPYNVVH